MKPTEIAEQYETAHLDGDAPLGQSETKGDIDLMELPVTFKRSGDPGFLARSWD